MGLVGSGKFIINKINIFPKKFASQEGGNAANPQGLLS